MLQEAVLEQQLIIAEGAWNGAAAAIHGGWYVPHACISMTRSVWAVVAPAQLGPALGVLTGPVKVVVGPMWMGGRGASCHGMGCLINQALERRGNRVAVEAELILF